MFGKMINRYYYGKSGKGDFTKEDLPANRWQLFWEMLRIHFSKLIQLNLITVIAFIPMIIVIGSAVVNLVNGVSVYQEMYTIVEAAGIQPQGLAVEEYNTLATEALLAAEQSKEAVEFFLSFNLSEFLQQYILARMVLLLVPCIAITGPFQAGMAYITRNWARDQHAFIWSDFKDAFKENWKQSLAVSVITSLVPMIVYVAWFFYGDMAANNTFFVVPQILVVLLAVIWALSLEYMYPMIVTYKAKLRVIFKNSILLAIGRLPFSVLGRVCMMLPGIIAFMFLLGTGYGMYAMLILAFFYLLLGNALARFVYASISNAAFDKYINAHMEGVEVNRGLRVEDFDEDDEEEAPKEEK